MTSDAAADRDPELLVIGRAQLQAIQSMQNNIHTIRQILVFWTVLAIIGVGIALALLSQQSS